MAYKRFLAMVLTSTVVMFALMYSTVWSASHIWFSQTRFYMALYMGATMAIIMLAFMLSERADLSEPRVEELARQIVETQRQEIAEMERLIAELEDE